MYILSADPTQNCTDGDIRLRGGATDSEGRVEICFNNHWGSICDNGWDISDATVVCKQLNYSTEGTFGLYHIQIWITTCS